MTANFLPSIPFGYDKYGWDYPIEMIQSKRLLYSLIGSGFKPVKLWLMISRRKGGE